MPSYPKTTYELLQRRLQEINEELERQCPALVKEKRSIEGVLASMEMDTDLIYSSVNTPWDAILKCLDLAGDFKLNKKEIVAEIMKGGYQAAVPKKARGLLNDSINYHVKKGLLAVRDELIGRPKNRSK
jgi:hypothetical protein